MKVLVGIKNASTMEAMLEYRSKDTEVMVVDSKEQFLYRLTEPFDCICIDAGIFYDTYPWAWLEMIKLRKPEANVLIALDIEVYDSSMLDIIQRLAADFGYSIIPYSVTDDQLAREITQRLFGIKLQSNSTGDGKFVTVMPAAAGDGGTTVSVNAAIALATKTKKNILLIDGNLKKPSIRANLNLKDRLKSNIQIRPKLQTGTLDPQTLFDACVKYKNIPNLFILPGTHRRETASDVSAEMIYNLIQVSKQTFDLTVMDVSGVPDNASTISGMRFADERWLIAQDNYDSYQLNWSEWYECWWKWCGLPLSDFKLILNRLSGSEKTDEISKIMGIELLAKIPNVNGGAGRRAVHDGIPLYLQSGTNDFISSINALSSTLLEIGEIEVSVENKKKSWNFRGFFKADKVGV